MFPDSKLAESHYRISDAAIATINETLRIDGNDYVFVGSKDRAPLVNYQKPWAKIRDAVGLPDLRLHDLCDNFVSEIIIAGTSLPVAGGLLG